MAHIRVTKVEPLTRAATLRNTAHLPQIWVVVHKAEEPTGTLNRAAAVEAPLLEEIETPRRAVPVIDREEATVRLVETTRLLPRGRDRLARPAALTLLETTTTVTS